MTHTANRAQAGIEVRGVSRAFDGFQALQDVDLEVRPGELIALLGPSGSGKTTLLRIIAGLESHDTGSVSIAGREATGLDVRSRGIGFVFQHYALFKHMTVAGNMGFALRMRKVPKARIAQKIGELLALFRLDGLAGRYPDELSGGQRQRVALARALASEPEILLLDEPFGALDARVRQELRRWLRRLHDDIGVTTVFVTHDQEEALEVADEIVVINEGRIEQVGTPVELYDEPANRFVMGFLGEVTTLGHHLIRPHDITVHTAPVPHAIAGTVVRNLRIGFEVRINIRPDGATDEWSDVIVTLTRTFANALGLADGVRVWLEPERGAMMVPVLAAAREETQGKASSTAAWPAPSLVRHG